jgi:hypothetical protein
MTKVQMAELPAKLADLQTFLGRVAETVTTYGDSEAAAAEVGQAHGAAETRNGAAGRPRSARPRRTTPREEADAAAEEVTAELERVRADAAARIEQAQADAALGVETAEQARQATVDAQTHAEAELQRIQSEFRIDLLRQRPRPLDRGQH